MKFNEVNAFTIICSVVDGFGMLISCGFLFLAVYRLYLENDVNLKVKCLANLSSICFGISSLCIFTYTIISQTHDSSFYSMEIRISGGISIFTWGVAKWCLAFIFADELCMLVGKNDSVYSLPDRVFNFLKIVLAIVPIFVILATVAFIRYTRLFIYFGIFIFVADFLWNLLICGFFYSSFKQMVIGEHNTSIHVRPIIQTMGRLTFLIIISLLVAVSLFIIMVCRAAIELQELNNVSVEANYVYISNCMLMGSCMANNIIIYFLFGRESYDRYCSKVAYFLFNCCNRVLTHEGMQTEIINEPRNV